jgi:hypothetical protein
VYGLEGAPLSHTNNVHIPAQNAKLFVKNNQLTNNINKSENLTNNINKLENHVKNTVNEILDPILDI